MNGIRLFPLINGIEPSWADLTINIAGVPVVGVRAIEYSDTQQIDNIYGMGQYPVGRGYGRIEATAKITLLRTSVEAIRASSVTGRLQDIAPFDIIVMFVPTNGGTIITHRLRDCQFKDDNLSISEGDTSNEQQFELILSQIERK